MFFQKAKLTVSFKSFRSENFEENKHDKKNIVVIYDLGILCENSVQKDF